jgi:hypothetical protein
MSDAQQRRKEEGWTLSRESRAKISAAGMRRINGPISDEHRAKIAAANRRRIYAPISDEHHAKLSAGRRRDAAMRRVMNIAETVAV